MSVSFYTAEMGLIASQKGMDVVANNMSNVSTYGYKAQRASFSDLLYTVRNEKNKDAETGHGSKLNKTDLMFDANGVVQTGGELDFAILGEGLFAVQTADGDTYYTKNGQFSLSEENGQWHLVDAKGANVLGADGNPIILAAKEDGTLDKDGLVDKIGVFTFENPYGLSNEGDNYFSATASSGEAAADVNAVKMKGYLEPSSANISEQMVNVIQLQRAFSFNAKMVQTSDDLENIINNLR